MSISPIYPESSSASLLERPITFTHEFLCEYFKVETSQVNDVFETLHPYFRSSPVESIRNFFSLIEKAELTDPIYQTLSQSGDLDAVHAASNTHEVIYENEYIRILKSVIHPDVSVPFHTHQWDSIMLTIQGSRFSITDGENETKEDWDPQAEKLEGSFDAISYKNIGVEVFKAITFEYKS